MQALIAWLGSAIASLLESGVLRFLATKVVLQTLFMVVLPIVLYNLFCAIIDEYMSFVTTHISYDSSSVVVHLTGLAGFLADRLGLVNAVSILMSAVAIRFTFRMIPFFGR